MKLEPKSIKCKYKICLLLNKFRDQKLGLIQFKKENKNEIKNKII